VRGHNQGERKGEMGGICHRAEDTGKSLLEGASLETIEGEEDLSSELYIRVGRNESKDSTSAQQPKRAVQKQREETVIRGNKIPSTGRVASLPTQVDQFHERKGEGKGARLGWRILPKPEGRYLIPSF